VPTQLSYDAVGATCVAEAVWAPSAPGYRRFEQTVLIGRGEQAWTTAARDVLRWAVKTRSGFVVHDPGNPDLRVRLGADLTVLASIGPWHLREPVTVVAVVDEPDRCGFAYGTRPGHPVAGEEAFVVHRAGDGGVWLTLRSVTRPARGAWRLAFPAALVAQRWYRRRYRRALRAR